MKMDREMGLDGEIPVCLYAGENCSPRKKLGEEGYNGGWLPKVRGMGPVPQGSVAPAESPEIPEAVLQGLPLSCLQLPQAETTTLK